MERYGRTTTEGSQFDPSLEWTAPVADTGFEGELGFGSAFQIGVGFAGFP